VRILTVPANDAITHGFYANNTSRRGSQPESGFMPSMGLMKEGACAAVGSFLSDQEAQRSAGKSVGITQLVLKIAQIGGRDVLGMPHK